MAKYKEKICSQYSSNQIQICFILCNDFTFIMRPTIVYVMTILKCIGLSQHQQFQCRI